MDYLKIQNTQEELNLAINFGYVDRVAEMFDFSAGVKQIFLSDLPSLISNNAEVCFIIVVGALICFLLPNSNHLAEKKEMSFRHAIYSAALLVASLACMGRVSTFLYFNF